MNTIEAHGRQTAAIEIRVERITALFDALDPFPLPSRDLAPTAEEFIVGWARELPHRAPLSIIVHVSEPSTDTEAGAKLQNAFQRHFSYRAERMTSDLRELFRIGRISLLIGLAVLAFCVLLSGVLEAQFSDSHVSRFFGEGLIIVGWVANWRPIEIFLYDWWPLVARRRLYTRLARAPLSLRAPPAVKSGS